MIYIRTQRSYFQAFVCLFIMLAVQSIPRLRCIHVSQHCAFARVSIMLNDFLASHVFCSSAVLLLFVFLFLIPRQPVNPNLGEHAKEQLCIIREVGHVSCWHCTLQFVLYTAQLKFTQIPQ